MPLATRPPAVAGAFYPSDGAELAREIERCFLDARGPGRLPERRRSPTRSIEAIVVPHAGYVYSGAIAAHAYARVADERPPGAVVVLGVDHHGAGHGPALSARPWATPIGPVAVAEELVTVLDRPPLTVDEAAHAAEHSIEVQLPFLDYVLPRPRLVAVQVPFAPLAQLERLGGELARRLAGRDLLWVASTDFSHYVPAATAERQDRRAIDAILAGSAERLYRTVVDEEISMCGIAPTTVLLAVLAGRPLRRTLLKWGHSGEVAPMRDVVGYASVAWEALAPGSPTVG